MSYYKRRQLLLQNEVAFDTTNCGNFYYQLWQFIYCKTETFIIRKASIANGTTLLQNTTGISIWGVYYTTRYFTIFDNFDNIFKKLIMRKLGYKK